MSAAVADANQKPIPGGEIAADRLYSLRELCRRMGWSNSALRSARRKGLPIRYMGGRGYCHGDALIKFVLEHGKTTK